MASAIFSFLQNLWPFSMRRIEDDLKASDKLVCGLRIPDQTKQFVYAIRDPTSQAVIYLLAAQNLSEQSTLDVEYLIKEVQPEAVIAQIDPTTLFEIHMEEVVGKNDHEEVPVPTSSFDVLKRSFLNKISAQQYEIMAGSQVLQDIFGIGFYGHFLTAKRVAKEVDSKFLYFESPYVNACLHSEKEADPGDAVSATFLMANNWVPKNIMSPISMTAKRLFLTDQHQLQMVKALSSSLALSLSQCSEPVQRLAAEESHPRCDYEAPSFAQSVYNLLSDLHDIFLDLPAIGKALANAQKMLVDIGRGDSVDAQVVSEMHIFRIAVEGLRIALNNLARSPINSMGSANSRSDEFLELPDEEKGHVILAHALKSQTKNFSSIVVVVDASRLAGLRKHWNTPVSREVAELAEQCFSENISTGEEALGQSDRKRLLADKPVVAVGAGASVAVGASSLSKAVPASAFMKLITYKIPVSLKVCLSQMQRTTAIGLTKLFGPAKVVMPGIASSAKTTALKASASSEGIRVVAHSVIASAERSSLRAMQSTFYEIMRRRRQVVGVKPWVAFSCSIATCAGLLVYGDGIECVVESAPVAPTIANLGRGLRSLHQASQEVKHSNGAKIHEAIKSFMNNLKKR